MLKFELRKMIRGLLFLVILASATLSNYEDSKMGKSNSKTFW